MKPIRLFTLPLAFALVAATPLHAGPAAAVILTPKPPATPRFNGPKIFVVRPASPFLYSIPATGERPMSFEAKGLPEGLTLDPATGRITGKLAKPGAHEITFTARNSKGSADKYFRIVAGDEIALTRRWVGTVGTAGVRGSIRRKPSRRPRPSSATARPTWLDLREYETERRSFVPGIIIGKNREEIPGDVLYRQRAHQNVAGS